MLQVVLLPERFNFGSGTWNESGRGFYSEYGEGAVGD